MKNRSKLLLLGWSFCTVLAGCTKKASNPYYANGTAPSLSASSMTIAPAPSDSLNNAVVFSWTDPKYPTPAPGPDLFTLQIDSSGRNFTKAVSISVSGVLNDSLTAKQLNDILLGFGFSFNVQYNVDVRVVSSYSNNNDQLYSNVLTIKATPYLTPPKVQPPASQALYIIGSATAGSWTQPVDVMTQQFTRVDSVDYQGTFYLAAGGAYDFLPVNGSWAVKYNVASNSGSGLSSGGVFEYSTGSGSDIPGPAQSGIYQIKVNFQTGYFTVTPVNVYTSLWVPGDYQGWTPATAPTLASINEDGKYEGYVNITTTNGFKFASEADWNGTNYGDTASNGMSGVLNAGGGNNLNIPAVGTYFLQADTKGLTWSAMPITMWGLIGDFNGWGGDVAMTYSASSNNWTGTIVAGAAGGFKIRANGAWTLSYGTGGPANSLTSNSGGNIPITAGTHLITFSVADAGYYTVNIQ